MTHGRLHTVRVPDGAGELAGLLVAVRRARVVEVTGPGESGRRLVRAAAERLASNFLDGVAVVELEHPHGPAELWAALGSVEGMPFLPFGTGDPIRWLAGQDVLLVLGGSDHLSIEARIWLRRLRGRGPGVRLLMAGRHSLGLGDAETLPMWRGPRRDHPEADTCHSMAAPFSR
ncbi:hypothetical protein [Streptomyces sp. NBC_00096]|uniref:hypothetical protein n=1 Tax=Streptomyces sp. NBC_00096 TaxID=2975650 RepID=UPI003246DEBD